MRKLLMLGLAIGAGGCVYPASEPSGIELSWRFVESNEVDGEDAVQVRSCEGARTEQLAFEIADEDEPRRHGTFRFDCLTGYQTAIELQTAASDAFVPLRAGRYAVSVFAVDDAMNSLEAERVEGRTVEVADRGVNVEIWELRRAPITWSVELRGGESCESLALSLVYAAPEVDLPDYTPSNDEPLPLYRAELRSDRDLTMGGQAIACGAAIDGVHRFTGIDRGVYELELDIDGQACPVRIDLGRSRDTTSVIDLASPPCEG